MRRLTIDLIAYCSGVKSRAQLPEWPLVLQTHLLFLSKYAGDVQLGPVGKMPRAHDAFKAHKDALIYFKIRRKNCI